MVDLAIDNGGLQLALDVVVVVVVVAAAAAAAAAVAAAVVALVALVVVTPCFVAAWLTPFLFSSTMFAINNDMTVNILLVLACGVVRQAYSSQRTTLQIVQPSLSVLASGFPTVFGQYPWAAHSGTDT
jgi:hypothetical protein